MGNNICGTSGSHKVYSPPATPRTTSGPSTSIGEETLTSVYQLSPSQRERFLDMHDPMRSIGLHAESELYRATDRRFIQNGRIAGNPSSGAFIRLHEKLRPNPYAGYADVLPHQAEAYLPEKAHASDLNVPSLNVLVGSLASAGANSYARTHNNHAVVKMRLGDFLERGGKVYADDSSNADDVDTSQALIVTLPRGHTVPVE
ncbi:AvrPphF family type III effector [Pseudomonas coronafaciens]|uniref:AvrPphF family type III effector n=1 Tax=Pseudomonas coronafaciens TaxID=53409 RepID=UPI000EFEB931|nr:AvrPphF family type III effector [Pseudomonas coronafaciens]RMP24052.1 hypothetical protein ALQ25_200048 [Pseudomonas coronafaciens pv. atropurpurea]